MNCEGTDEEYLIHVNWILLIISAILRLMLELFTKVR